MRLECPECAARYEVPATAVPGTGRTVQCSACDAVWFQTPKALPPMTAPTTSASGDDGDPDEAEFQADDTAGWQGAARPDHARSNGDRSAAAQIAREEIALAALAARARAARENANARAAGLGAAPGGDGPVSGSSASQPQADSDAASDRDRAEIEASNAAVAAALSRRARSAYADQTGERPVGAVPTSAPAGPRAPVPDRAGPATGFSTGLALALLLFLGFLSVYALRTPISAAIPQTEGFVGRYAGEVDRARGAVRQVQAAVWALVAKG